MTGAGLPCLSSRVHFFVKPIAAAGAIAWITRAADLVVICAALQLVVVTALSRPGKPPVP